MSTNDALGLSFSNIGKLLNTKNVFFVPFFQDDYIHKPKSLIFDASFVIQTLEDALEYKQVQPILSNKQ